jgi:hypothetical protein
MANYYSQGRTNYFRVKDEEKFEEIINSLKEGVSPSMELIKDERGYCLLFEEGIPTYFYNEENGEEYDVDMEGLIRENLADGSVCVMMEIGAEKLRFLDGWSIAFNNKGDRKVILLDDIYHGIESFGECTQCEY